MLRYQVAGTVTLFTFILAGPVLAQNSPVGLWKNVEDDKTTLIRITEAGGKLQGKIEKVLKGSSEDSAAKCVKCKDDKKDKPLAGLELIWDMAKVGDRWEGGKLLDPETGRIVNCRLELADAGKKLNVRGSVSFLSKTQTWTREE
jgi:uncharacterized protein (DUF2147 family)